MICQDLCRMVRALCKVQYLKKFGRPQRCVGKWWKEAPVQVFLKHVWANPTQFLIKNTSWNIQVLWKVVESRKIFSVNISRSGWQNSVGSECVRDGSCNVLLKDKASHTFVWVKITQNMRICSTLEDDLVICCLKGRICFLSLLIVHDGVRFGSTSCQYSPLSNGCCLCCLKTYYRFGPDVVDRSRYVSFMHRQIRTPPRPTESWFCVKSHLWKTTVTEALVECHQTSSALETQEPPIFLDIFGLLVGILKDFLEQSCCCTSDRDPQQIHKKTRYFCDLVFQTFRFSKQMEPHGTVCWSKSLGDSNQGERFLFEVRNLYSFREFKSPSFAWCGWTFLRGPCFFDSEDPMWVVSDWHFCNMETSLRTVDKEFSGSWGYIDGAGH